MLERLRDVSGRRGQGIVSYSLTTLQSSHIQHVKGIHWGDQLAFISAPYQDRSLLAFYTFLSARRPWILFPSIRFMIYISPKTHHLHLWKAVTTINNDIRASCVARRITGKVQVRALELVCLTLTSHWDLVLPDRLSLGWHEVADLSGHVARADRVGTSETNPLDGEGLACRCVSDPVSNQIVCRSGIMGDVQRWITPALAALYADWSCGMLTMCPLMLAVATKLP